MDELLVDLNAVIGLESVKKSIQENITYLNFTKLRKEKGFDYGSSLALHVVFTGNAGTCKTIVVKQLGKIYHKMGLLSKRYLYEVDRSILVGEYIGQTAPKVKKVIDVARGGILFMDEAYALASASENDFGKEVIETLIKEMSDGKGDIAVIVAGYPDNMHKFIETNSGLKSRFDKTYVFNDYNSSELLVIAKAVFKLENLALNAEAHIKLYFESIISTKDKFFGNARTARQVVGACVKKQHLRMASLISSERNEQALLTVKMNDVKNLITEKLENKQPLGFRFGAS